MIKCLAEDPLSFEPGTRWQYSLCHDVFAAVVEVISGKRFRDYVRENIFAPLAMNESYYHNEDVLDKVAEMYRYENDTESDLVKLQSEAKNTALGRAVNVGKTVSLIFGSEYDSGATVLADPALRLSVFYTHHMLNPQEEYYQPRLRNVLYTCLGRSR